MEPNYDDAKKMVAVARRVAKEYRHQFTGPIHLLVACLKDEKVIKTLTRLNVNLKSLLDEMDEHLSQRNVSKHERMYPLLRNEYSDPTDLDDVGKIINLSVTQSLITSTNKITASDLLIGIYKNGENNDQDYAVFFMKKYNIDADNLERAIYSKGAASSVEAITKYCINFNELAKEGKLDTLIGRETDVVKLIKIMARRNKPNAIIFGPEGTGKSAIIEGFAKLIVEDQVPNVLKDKIVISLDIGALMAGTRYRGDMEERMKMIIEAVSADDNPYILFIDEIHTVMKTGSGSDGGLDISNMLKPALARGKMRAIGATTTQEFRKYFEKDRAFMRRFAKMEIFETDVETTKKILMGIKSSYEEFHNVHFSEEIISMIVELSDRYIRDRNFPDKSIDLMDLVGATQRIIDRTDAVEITSDMVQKEISEVAKVPVSSVNKNNVEKLKTLESNLKKTVIGQDIAIDKVVNFLFMKQAGLRKIGKTSCAFMFNGTTGCGKTFTAEMISKFLGIPLLKYDMSEYMEPHSISKLIGSPPGYVGYGDGAMGDGKLINDVESYPHSVILIDELEKAHHDIQNIFLQILDKASLTSSSGKTVNFENCIIIFTTNAGANEMAKNPFGIGRTVDEDDIMEAINKRFTPEFRNRFDDIIVFNNLTVQNMEKIVDNEVQNLNNMKKDCEVNIVLTKEARKWFATNGYDKLKGARPLERLISNKISVPLSKDILFENVKNGQTVMVDISNNEVTLSYIDNTVTVPSLKQLV